MSKEPLVSVIMNCYNGEKYLGEAIDSVYAQTYKNWEIIFWDNASTDNSAIIAKSYDKKIQYFHTKQNTVLGKARVLAVNEAKGEYLTFLDCDDLWNRNKLEKQIEIVDDKLGIIYSRSEVISGNGEILDTIPNKEGSPGFGEVFGELAKENFIPFLSALVPKDKYYAVGGFSEKYKTAVDYDLFLKLSYSYRVEFIDEILCKYRQHSSNLSLVQKSLGIEENISTIRLFTPDNRAVIGIKHHYSILAINYIKEKKFYKALVILIKKNVLGLVLLRITKKLKKILF
jgi:glycosyltransferase involved in cell wall biosynthesis